MAGRSEAEVRCSYPVRISPESICFLWPQSLYTHRRLPYSEADVALSLGVGVLNFPEPVFFYSAER